MGKNDREHFTTYTDQNRVKHEVLGKYFGAYTRSLSNAATAFHYIDGFAGPGRYEKKVDGSPLIAGALLSKQPLPFSISLVEDDSALFSELESVIGEQPPASHQFEPCFLRRGKFESYVDEILRRNIYSAYPRAATFAFVDPCGVRGVRMRDLAQILARPDLSPDFEVDLELE
jgi:three-Cys-motif partner protein